MQTILNKNFKEPGRDTREQFSFFYKVRNTRPSGKLTLSQLAKVIREDEHLKKLTTAILAKHQDGILDNFTTIDKGQYQTDKAKSLPVILPAGIAKDRGEDLESITFLPSGLLCLDIDENTPDELTEFYLKIKAGKRKGIVFASQSVSGSLNGSLTIFVRVEMPKRFKDVPQRLKSNLGLSDGDSWPQSLDKINKAYYQLITTALKTESGINAGNKGQNIKDLRYLAHDAGAYFNPEAETVKLKALETFSQVNKAHTHTVVDWPKIEGNTAFQIADSYAQGKDAFQGEESFQLIDGQKHHYILQFSKCCNLLGVPQLEVEKYFDAKGIVISSNCITDPYNRYSHRFGHWAGLLKPKAKRRTIQGKEGQRLTDLITPAEALGKWIISPTGSGKTFLFDKIELQPGEKKILVVPTLSLVSNVIGGYPGIIEFTGRKKDLKTITQESVIVTTIASAHRLMNCLTDHKAHTHIVFDEGHNFTAATSPGFQLSQLTDALENAKGFKTVSLLTGTELFNADPYLNSLEVIEVRIPQTVTPEACFIDTTDTKKAAAEIFNQSTTAGRFPILLLNDKGLKLETLKTLIGDMKGIKVFNSDTKQDADFLSITQDSIIKDGIKGIITTSVLNEGNNINNPFDFDFIVLGNFHSNAMKQLSARARHPESVNIYKIRSIERETSDKGFNPVQFAILEEKRLQKIADFHNSEIEYFENFDPVTQSEEIHRANVLANYKGRKTINKTEALKLNDAGRYEIDYLLLSNNIHRAYTIQENKNDTLMIRNLEAYGIRFIETVNNEAQQTESEKTAAKISREARKTADAIEYAETLKELQTAYIIGDGHPVDIAQEQINTKGQRLTTLQQSAYKRFLRLFEITQDVSITIKELLTIGHKNKDNSLFFDRLQNWQNRNDGNFMRSGLINAKIQAAAEVYLPPGKVMTSDQVKESVKQILSCDKFFNLAELDQDERNDKALNHARKFVDLKPKRKRNDDGKTFTTTYTICALTFKHLFYNNSKLSAQEDMHREIYR